MTPEYRLAVAFLQSHPRDAALVLERLPDADAAGVARAVPVGAAAAALREMARGTATELLGHLGASEAGPILAVLAPDESADLLRRLPTDARDRILGELPDARRERVVRLLRYPDDTAGALMDPSILDLPADILVAEAQDRVRVATRDLLYYLYVVDDARRLVGVLDIPELMAARPSEKLRTVMHGRVDRLSAWSPPSVIRAHPGWQHYHAMPVVDEQDRLLGAIRYQTLRRLEERAVTGGPPPATVTALALGELFHVGVAGLLGSLASAGIQGRPAAVPGDADPRDRVDVSHG